jgi:hypothetical protein
MALALAERSRTGDRVLAAQFWRASVPQGCAVVRELEELRAIRPRT